MILKRREWLELSDKTKLNEDCMKELCLFQMKDAQSIANEEDSDISIRKRI